MSYLKRKEKGTPPRGSDQVQGIGTLPAGTAKGLEKVKEGTREGKVKGELTALKGHRLL